MSTIEKAIERLQEAGGEENLLDFDPDVAAASRGGDAAPPTSRKVEVDLERLKRMGYIYPGIEKNYLSEEFRRIKRPLLHVIDGKTAVVQKDANLIMVTSAMPGEGKTFTAVNLAMSLAKEVDRTVLLIDADVERPSVSRVLGLDEGKGLLEYLAGDLLRIPDLILETNVPRLRLIQAGLPRNDSTELLSSNKMRRFLSELSQRYNDRVIVIDSPPLLMTSQSKALAELAGQILVVVEAGRTGRDMLHNVLSELDRDKAISLVLNKQPAIISEARYGYGYGYGYGYDNESRGR